MTNRIIASTLTALFLAASVASAEPLHVAGAPGAANASASGIRASMAAVRFEPERARQAEQTRRRTRTASRRERPGRSR